MLCLTLTDPHATDLCGDVLLDIGRITSSPDKLG